MLGTSVLDAVYQDSLQNGGNSFPHKLYDADKPTIFFSDSYTPYSKLVHWDTLIKVDLLAKRDAKLLCFQGTVVSLNVSFIRIGWLVGSHNLSIVSGIKEISNMSLQNIMPHLSPSRLRSKVKVIIILTISVSPECACDNDKLTNKNMLYLECAQKDTYTKEMFLQAEQIIHDLDP